jgi:hypothetical protein
VRWAKISANKKREATDIKNKEIHWKSVKVREGQLKAHLKNLTCYKRKKFHSLPGKIRPATSQKRAPAAHRCRAAAARIAQGATLKY